MTEARTHADDPHHVTHHGRLCAAVLDANDGIVSVFSRAVGVAVALPRQGCRTLGRRGGHGARLLAAQTGPLVNRQDTAVAAQLRPFAAGAKQVECQDRGQISSILLLQNPAPRRNATSASVAAA